MAQALYEKKLITYPRTDSRYLTEDMARTVLEIIACSLKLPPFNSIADFHACLLYTSGDERTHQIHIFSERSFIDIERHLAVRDYLRAHKNVCDEYAKIKIKLAKQFPYDIDGYCDGKEEFVRQMESDALQWKHTII